MQTSFGFWARALLVPALAVLCAYATYMSSLGSRTIFIYLLIVFLLSANIASLVRESARGVFVVVAAVFFGLSVIEAISFLLETKPTILTGMEHVFTRHAVFGWGAGDPGVYHAKMVAPKTGKTIFNATYTIDTDRLRKTVSADRGPTIAFFGDSFTFGVGVNDLETMPQAFADLTDHKIRVLNLGFWAYSPQQFQRAMETGVLDKIIGPDLRLFVFLTAPWQSDRVACKADYVTGAPRYVLENGTPTYVGTCYDHGKPKLRALLSHVATYRVFFQRYFSMGTKADIDLFIAETIKAVELEKARYHAPTLVLYIASGKDNLWMSGYTDQDIMDRLRAGGVPVLDVSLAAHTYNNPNLSIPGDYHPTPYAHRERALLLKQFLESKMPDVLAGPKS